VEGWLELVRQGVLDGALISGLEFQGELPADAPGLELLPLGEVALELAVSGCHPHADGEQPEVLVPMRQSVAQISAELGIHVVTLYNWRKAWRLQGEVVPASEKEPEGWSAADKFTVVMETAGLNATELSAYCRERGLFPEQVERWRQAAQDANEKPVLTLKEQKELEKLRAQDQREIKALKKELQRKEKAMAEMAALLVLRKKWEAFCSEDAEG
jgi:transposase